MSLFRVIMKVIIFLSFFCGFSQLHHQTIGIGGGSTSLGVIYSVGQSSVIGNNMSGGFLITQGYVQPVSDSYYVEDIYTNFNAAVYPNPFVKEFEASFEKVYNNINVLIHVVQVVFKLIPKSLASLVSSLARQYRALYRSY